MGNWTIAIQGTGAKSNGAKTDADALALDATVALLKAGQRLTRAEIRFDDDTPAIDLLERLPRGEAAKA